MEEELTMTLPQDKAGFSAVDEALLSGDWQDGDDASMQPGDQNDWDNTPDDGKPLPNEREADQSFKLKYMGEEIDVTRDEVITLAQKGKDYDRIRSRAEQLTEEAEKNSTYKNLLQGIAQRTGMSLDSFMRQAETALSDSTKQPANETAHHSEGITQPDAQAARARRDREVTEFLSEYSDLDPKSIPGEVWESVQSGKSLLRAYQSYENRNLKAQLASQQKDDENRRRAAGSRQSAGLLRTRGEIEDDWYQD
ncbi:hypothetical protein IZU99_03080 [Oscillospiraceae bacterium CM]|nr:hypothetical protein IZU99_03080 [Oscillospiraceae bacterium CM]